MYLNPSLNKLDKENLSLLHAEIVENLFNDNINCPLSLHNICKNGSENNTGQAGKFWGSSYAMFCIKRILETIKPMLIKKSTNPNYHFAKFSIPHSHIS